MIKASLQILGGRGAKLLAKPIPMTLEEYLAKRGLLFIVSNYGLDKIGGANRTGETERQRRKFEREYDKHVNDYHNRREAAISEYKKQVAQGKIRDKTPVEREMEIARGHEDLAATHAARRMLAKRGYDWKTGKKLK